MVGTWLGEICSCSCLAVLPDSAWVLLNKIYQPFFTSLYMDGMGTCGNFARFWLRTASGLEIISRVMASCERAFGLSLSLSLRPSV